MRNIRLFCFVAGRAIDDMITEVTTLGGALGERHQTKKIK